MSKVADCRDGLERRNLDRRASLLLRTLCLALLWLTAGPQAVADQFFMQKKAVEMAPSTRFETITIYETDSAGNPRALVLPSRAAPLIVPPQIGRLAVEPYLEQYGVVLVRMAPAVNRAELDPIVERYNRSVAGRLRAFTGREADGNPMYSSGNVDRLVVNEVFVRFRPRTDRAVAEAFLRSRGAEVITAPDNVDTDSYLVRFTGESGQATRELSNRMDAASEVAFAQPSFITIDHRRLPGGAAAAHCSLACPEDVPLSPGGDPYLKKQWHLNNTGTVGTRNADINAFNAWRVSEGNPSVVVAILDDAIQTNHEDLAGQFAGVWSAFPPSASNNCSSVVPGPNNEHGTAVAGLVGAIGKNGKGVRGVAPLVKMLAVRMICGAALPDPVVKDALTHAAQHANVLSMSWSLDGPAGNVPEITAKIQEVVNTGRVLVIAADNQGAIVQGAFYPASLAESMPIIAVSATETSDALQEASTSCAWTTNNSRDTVSAPGVLLYTTDQMGDKGYCSSGNNSNYVVFDGTSGSTPIVAGIVALMLSKKGDLTPTQIRDKLRQTARHPNRESRPDDGNGWGLGYGRVDACRALEGGWCWRLLPPRPFFGIGRPIVPH
jgi:subtilisin family serine protease